MAPFIVRIKFNLIMFFLSAFVAAIIYFTILFFLNWWCSPSEIERRTERRNEVESEPTQLSTKEAPKASTRWTKLAKAWKFKYHILSAFLTLHFSRNRKVRATIATRRSICESNACGHYDKYGVSEHVVVRNKPACDICGCNTLLLCSYLQGVCSLSDIDLEPLWKPFGTSDKPPI